MMTTYMPMPHTVEEVDALLLQTISVYRDGYIEKDTHNERIDTLLDQRSLLVNQGKLYDGKITLPKTPRPASPEGRHRK